MTWNTNIFSEMDQMRRNMEALWDAVGEGGISRYDFPQVNVYEDRDGYTFAVNVPGMEKDKIDLRFADNRLTISGERPRPTRGEKTRTDREEREYGGFERNYRIPVKVDTAAATAELKNGILTVRIPKAEEAKPKQITIQT